MLMAIEVLILDLSVKYRHSDELSIGFELNQNIEPNLQMKLKDQFRVINF